MVEFSVTSNETITVSPEYVGSRLLLKLKEMAEEYLGMPVANAVISVPAEFDLKQRNSTIEAANLAGKIITFARVTFPPKFSQAENVL